MHRNALKLLFCALMLLFVGTAVAQEVSPDTASQSGTAEQAQASTEAVEAGAQASEASAATSAEDATAPSEMSTAAEGTGEVLTDALLDKQLHEVSTSVDALKEDTFTTKSRLLLLREEVLQRSVNGARLQLRHRYDMGGQYELVQMYYAIDQETVFSRQDMTGKLSDMNDEVIFDKMLSPGPHQISVLYIYRGKAWGVFQYMKDYTFRVESGYDFIIDEGKAAELVVTAAEDGDAFTAYQDRPSVQYQYQQYDLTAAKVASEDKDVAPANATE